MNEIALKVKSLKKVYRLGQIGTGTISHDLNKWFDKIRGRENRYTKIGEKNDRSSKSGTNSYVNVLDDINFEIPKGEVVGIIGKNGAGKSTLLKVISQITSPTSGTIKANGRIASLLEVGTGMHPEMSGKENVYLNGTILGMTKKEIDEKYDEIMEFAGCAKYADTPVKRYSSGMKVRLGFAVAAFLEPEILIVDEVLAVGDAEFQKKAIGKMQDISKGGGRTVLFVSHNMGTISAICNSCIILDKGKVSFNGPVSEAINHYNKLTENFNESIDQIIDRAGDGRIHCKDLVFREVNFNDKIHELICGNNYELEIKLESLLEFDSAYTFGIGIFDISDKYVSTISSKWQGVDLLINKRSESQIVIQLNKLPLMPGEYYLKINISSVLGLHDSLDKVYKFKVYPGVFYGENILKEHRAGVLINYEIKRN